MKKSIWARVILMVGVISLNAESEVIFDNGGTLLQGGLLSTVGTHYLSADDFVLSEGASTLADIHWWGYYAEETAPLDSFTVYVYSDAGGAPGTVLHTLTNTVVREDTGGDTFGEYPEYAYHMDFSAIDLTAGTTYWLAIQNDVDCNWFWSIADFAGGNAHQKLQLWHNYAVEEAFYLTGPTVVMPEPASVVLMGVGLVGVALRRRFINSKI